MKTKKTRKMGTLSSGSSTNWHEGHVGAASFSRLLYYNNSKNHHTISYHMRASYHDMRVSYHITRVRRVSYDIKAYHIYKPDSISHTIANWNIFQIQPLRSAWLPNATPFTLAERGTRLGGWATKRKPSYFP